MPGSNSCSKIKDLTPLHVATYILQGKHHSNYFQYFSQLQKLFFFAKLITINVLLHFFFMVHFILRTSPSSYLFYTLILSLLFHQDFTTEQYNVNPRDGWKAYYAATRAVIIVNSEFYNIIRERSLPSMSRFWLNADYVKCVHSSGELFSGYCLYLINKPPMFTSIEFYIAGFLFPA